MAAIHTLCKFVYSVGAILIVVLACLAWFLFGGYADRSIENLVRSVRRKEADDDVIHLVGSWASKAESFLDLLAWGLFFMTLIAVISLIFNWMLLIKWRSAKEHIQTLRDIERDS